jgi:hypothetical protein
MDRSIFNTPRCSRRFIFYPGVVSVDLVVTIHPRFTLDNMSKDVLMVQAHENIY